MILDHNRKPKNYREIEDATHKAEGHNPLCGDHIWVFLKISESNIIEDISFTGDGCAICKASASMMTISLKGKSVEELHLTFNNFIKLITGKECSNLPSEFRKLRVFSGVKQYPTRIKCAGLVWHTVVGALKGKNEVNTESGENAL